MVRREGRIARIARLTSKRFPSLSASGGIDFGVMRADVEQIVRFVLTTRDRLESRNRKKIGNDARDISYTSALLESLQDKALQKIPDLREREIRKQLRNKAYPFSRLNKETRERLLHLPISWIREGAQWQLNSRKSPILLLR